MWTKHIPSTPGYYGYRSDGSRHIECFELTVYADGSITFYGIGYASAVIPDDLEGGYFSGPIHFPEFDIPQPQEEETE